MDVNKLMRILKTEGFALGISAGLWILFLSFCWILAQGITWLGVVFFLSAIYYVVNGEPTVTSDDERRRKNYKVIIVGSGFSGLCTAVKLKRAKVPFIIIEKSETLGGTWWDNKYPGCACDIMSHLYSLSFFPNPFWSKTYPSQPEILAYLQEVATRFKLWEHFKFNKRVEECVWNESRHEWTVTTTDGEEFMGTFLVSGMGALHVPKRPNFEGANTFKGTSFHTTEWPSDFDWTDKKLCVIGTGATSVQVVPSLVDKAKSLHVFQRTAVWTTPRLDFAYPPFLQTLFSAFPLIMRLHRWYIFLRNELGFFAIFGLHSKLGKTTRDQVTAIMQNQIQDPVLKKKLTPDFDLGCKRITVSNDYVRSFNSPHVTLVTDPIRRIREEGVVYGDGSGEEKMADCDAIIYATGFDILGSAVNMRVIGKDGLDLAKIWGDTPNAYLGITYPNFPNLFYLLGPNTGLGHNSVVWMIECQVNYVVDAILKCAESRIRSLDVRKDINDGFQSKVQNWMKSRVFYAGCRSWYQNASGVIVALWPSHLLHYWWITRKLVLDEYHVIS